MKNFISKLDPKGVASLVVTLLVLINQALSMQGKGPLPINGDQLNDWVSTGITGVVSLYAYFSNNSLTKKPNDGGDNGGKTTKE